MRRKSAAVAYAGLATLAFGGSLAYFAYFYLVRLGRSADVAPLGLTEAVLFDMALFGVFALHHSVMARAGIKQRLTKLLPPNLERATYVWVASILFFVTCLSWRGVPGHLYLADGPLRFLGYAIQLLGLGLTVASTTVLDVRELAGIRQAQGSMERRGTDGLRVIGPYRWIRHPLYLGWMLIVFGAPSMTASRLEFACISTVYLLVAIPWEERSMRDAYGHEYLAYRDQVRWRVIPGLY